MTDFYINDNLNPEIAKKTYKIQVDKQITVEDIENIMVTAIEGGIGYWSVLKANTPEWVNKPKGLPVSQYATQLLVEGKEVVFFDSEENEKDADHWTLTLEKLLNGIVKNTNERPQDADLDNMDALTADCIVQFALFDEVVYG